MMSNIPGTNVPAVSFGANGFQAPSGPAVLAGVQQDWNAAFGRTLSYELTTPQGQIASSTAALVINTNSIFVYYTNQVNPAYSTGRMQDGIAAIYGIQRLPALPTVLQVACLGAQGVVIAVGAVIQDTSENLYACTAGGEIPAGGTITLPFACTLPGPTPIPGANDVSIYQAQPQWDAVSVASGVVGVNVESAADLEARRQATVAGNSFGAIGSIIGAVAKVDGVVDYWGYDNGDGSPVTVSGVTIAAHSIFVSVSGGSDADVAQAILSKKGPGCGYTGNTTVVAYDSNPLYSAPVPYNVTFERPDSLPILFAVGIASGPNVPADAETQIQNAIIDAFAGGDGGQRARIAATLYATRYVAPVAALGSWATVTTLEVGSANTAAATFVGRIAGTTLTIDSGLSGSIAAGQFVTDPDGVTQPGTKIASGSGSTWTVNIPQTAGASFTGNGSGTNLTVTAASGIISTGDAVIGTGVPSGTAIVSQTSGSPGGNGVYVTSNPTTASAASLTAGPVMSGALADQSQVAVRGDQEPTVVAGDIAVTLV